MHGSRSGRVNVREKKRVLKKDGVLCIDAEESKFCFIYEGAQIGAVGKLSLRRRYVCIDL